MDVTSRCTLGDPNKLPEGVPQPARMPYISDKHPRQTLEVINLLRKHRELCDVVLVVGAKKIYAHRVILSACSPYFRAMFTGELAESRQTEVVIRDIDERAMELLIDFAYTSQITVEEGNVQTLLPAACLLQLAEIQEACCEFLKRQLDPSNCLGIRAFADTHSCRELLRIADKFTQHNFQEVSCTWWFECIHNVFVRRTIWYLRLFGKLIIRKMKLDVIKEFIKPIIFHLFIHLINICEATILPPLCLGTEATVVNKMPRVFVLAETYNLAQKTATEFIIT